MSRPIPQVSPIVGKEDSIDLTKYLDFIVDNRWLIAGVALVIALLGVVYAMVAKPVYEANILLQVEDRAAAPKNILGDMSSIYDLKVAAASEMEILRSRMVVARAVDNARLYIEVQPKYIPWIGDWLARRNKGLSQPGLLGYGGYVWGAEKAEVRVFTVPEALEGAAFKLIAEGKGNYRLREEIHGIDIKGRVADALKVKTRQGEIALLVDRLDANPGAEFSLVRGSHMAAIEGLQKALTISEKAKQSGIIGVSLTGSDPKLTSAVLNEIGREYIRQNEDRKAEEAEKSLAFLTRQMPELKQELERSEAKYNELRNSRGTVDLGEEARTILQRSSSTQTKMVELRQEREKLLTRFQSVHPAVDAVDQQMRDLGRELANVEARIKKLPAVEQNVVRLSRDVKVNTDLYTSLMAASQQLRLATSNKMGSARLLDTAVVPATPVKPKRFLVMMLAVAVGAVLGVAAAIVRKAFSGRIDDPREIEQLGMSVSATIPHSASQKQLSEQVQNKEKKVSVLQHTAPSDGAVESFRTFRNSLQFAMARSRNNIVMITGPSPGVGKSFVSANFATVLASIGNKVLLIDADLRTGHLHRYFGLERSYGLSEAVEDKTALDRIIRKDVVAHMDFMSTGELPSNPADLLAHRNFGKLLQRLSSRYDFVLIDTTPVLALADALTLATHAGAIFNIVRSGVSTVGEIEESVKRLNQAGHAVTGVVFNDLKSRSARYGYGSKYDKYVYA